VCKKLSSLLSAEQVTEEVQDLKNYGRDWTRVYESSPAAVVFPKSTADVQKLVRWARDEKKRGESIAFVPSGGRTGLSAGAVAAKGEVVISLEKMNEISEFNEVDRLVRSEAGVVTQNLQDFIRQKNYFFPVDFASRGSSQIGGNISTNAGGTKVIRYGLMREWVAGLEVVTGAGDILKMDQGLTKNNAGYDLKHLFIGSEGTLGIITSAILKFTTQPKNLCVALLQSAKLEFSTEILRRFSDGLSLTAFEFFSQAALDKVLASQSGEASPFERPAPIYFLIEFENSNEADLVRALQIFDDAKSDGLVLEGSLSQNDQQLDKIWMYRENISEALAPLKPYKNDISVRISKIPDFVREAEGALRKEFPKTEIIWFGHIGDGNLHINVIGSQENEKLSLRLFEILQKYNGSISAEHGIGILKKPYLHLSRSAEEIRVMKQLKAVLDPDSLLNPGKVFDLDKP